MRACLKRLTYPVFVMIRANQLLIRRESSWEDPSQVQASKQDPAVFRAFSFGQIPIVVDWYLLKCLLDPSLASRVAKTHPVFYYDLDLITDLDPRDMEFYTAGGNLLSIVHKDGRGAQSLLDKGALFFKNELSSYPHEFQDAYWKDPWRLFLLQAYVSLFELGDLPRAAQAFARSSQQSGSPAYLQSLESRLSQPGGQYEVGLRLLKFMRAIAPNDLVREAIDKKVFNLSVGQYLDQINRAFTSFLHTEVGCGVESAWKKFLHVNQMTDQDPWHGTLTINALGKVVSTTSHESVFGLE